MPSVSEELASMHARRDDPGVHVNRAVGKGRPVVGPVRIDSTAYCSMVAGSLDEVVAARHALTLVFGRRP